MKRFVATIHVLVPNDVSNTSEACDWLSETLRPLVSDWAYVGDGDAVADGSPVEIDCSNDAEEGEFVNTLAKSSAGLLTVRRRAGHGQED